MPPPPHLPDPNAAMIPGFWATAFYENWEKASISHLRYHAFWKRMKSVVVRINYVLVETTEGKKVAEPASCGGIVVNANGLVLTCDPESLGGDIQDLKVQYEGEICFRDARIVDYDDRSLILIEPDEIPDQGKHHRHYAMFANCNHVHVGAPVIGITHAGGLPHALAFGEVSYPFVRDPLPLEDQEGTPLSRTLNDCIVNKLHFSRDMLCRTSVIQTNNTHLSVGAEGCPIFNPSGLVLGIFVVAKNGFDYFLHAEDLEDYIDKYEQKIGCKDRIDKHKEQLDSRVAVLPPEVSSGDWESSDSENGPFQSLRQLKVKGNVAREYESNVSEERSPQDNVTEATNEFENLVGSSPNNSSGWINYMTYISSVKDIEKARSIAERALKTINPREKGDVLNIWIALLNLEHEHGSLHEEGMSKTFEKAVHYCDPKKLHLALLGIYEKNRQFAQADELVEDMTKKYWNSCKVWLRSVEYLLKQGKDGFMTVGIRAILRLPGRKLVKFFSQNAVLDFKYGTAETGRAMFESILELYPERTELFCLYLDAEIRHVDFGRVRALFDRAICSSPQQKTKLLKKYLELEKLVGDEERIELVNRKLECAES